LIFNVDECVSQCPGPITWLKGDSGISQVHGAAVNRWYSASFSTDAVASGVSNRPVVNISSTADPTFITFDGVDDALQLDQTFTSLQRPMTICVVDRYTAGSGRPRKRNLQGSNS
jgi:hypothetical protein